MSTENYSTADDDTSSGNSLSNSIEISPSPTVVSESPPKPKRSRFLTWLLGTSDASGQVHDLYERSPFASTLKIAGPPTLAYFASGVMLIIDRVIVGQLLGPAALAALSYASAYDPLIKAIGAFTGVGGNQHISEALGAGDVAAAERSLGLAFFGNVVFSLLGMAILLPTMDAFMRFSGAKDEYLSLSKEYSLPLIAGVIGTVFQRSLSGLLLAEGRSILSCALNVLVAILNSVLGFVFVQATDMGIAGTGAGSVVSAAIVAILLIWFYAAGYSTVRLRVRHLVPRSASDWRLLGNMLYVGAGDVIGTLSGAVTSVVIAIVSTKVLSNADMYTEEELEAGLAATGALGTIFNLLNEIFSGLCSAGLIPMLAFAHGRCDRERFWRILRENIVLSAALAAVLTLVLVGGAHWVVKIFGTGHPYEEMAAKMIRYANWTIILIPPQFYSISAAQAVGDGLRAGVVSILCYCVFCPSFYAILGLTTGNIYYASLGFPLNDTSSCILSFLVFIPSLLKQTAYPGVPKVSVKRIFFGRGCCKGSFQPNMPVSASEESEDLETTAQTPAASVVELRTSHDAVIEL